MAGNEVVIHVKGDSRSAEQAMQRASGSMDNLAKQASLLLKGFLGFKALSFGADLLKDAAKAEQTRESFQRLAAQAGQSSEGILAALKQASAGTVNSTDLMLSANRAMVLGVAQNTGQFTTLMEIARDRARAMGLTTQQAFNDIVTGIGRGSPMILDNLGITVNATEANSRYATSIGKTAEQLSDAERKQALLNAVLDQGKASLDTSASGGRTAAENFEAMNSNLKNLGERIGGPFLFAVDKAVEAINKVLAPTPLSQEPFAEIAQNMTDAQIKANGLTGEFAIMGRTLVSLGREKQFEANLRFLQGWIASTEEATLLMTEANQRAVEAVKELQEAEQNMGEELLRRSLASAQIAAEHEARIKKQAEDTADAIAEANRIFAEGAAAAAARVAEEQARTAAEFAVKDAQNRAKAELDATTKILEEQEKRARAEAAALAQADREARDAARRLEEDKTRAAERGARERADAERRAQEQLTRDLERVTAERMRRLAAIALGEGAATPRPSLLPTLAADIGQAYAGLLRNITAHLGPDAVAREAERIPTLQAFTDVVRGLEARGDANALSEALGRFGRLFGVPGYAHGGEVPGPVGAPQLAVVHGGETISPAGRGGQIVIAPVLNNYGVLGIDDAEEWVIRSVRKSLDGGGFPQLKRR